MYAFNWALTAFRSESYIGSATALPDYETCIIFVVTKCLLLVTSGVDLTIII